MVERTFPKRANAAPDREPVIEVLPPLNMTAAEFEAWLKASGMSRRAAARFFGRKPRTIDSWRKGRRPVPEYAICMIQRRNG
ncbi:MAG: hypothetical protein AB7F35_01075 [Acetobacteraceae bacterium]